MTVRYNEVHKLVWRVISKDCKVEVVGADCEYCKQHRVLIITNDNTARCVTCLKEQSMLPDPKAEKNQHLNPTPVRKRTLLGRIVAFFKRKWRA